MHRLLSKHSVPPSRRSIPLGMIPIISGVPKEVWVVAAAGPELAGTFALLIDQVRAFFSRCGGAIIMADAAFHRRE